MKRSLRSGGVGGGRGRRGRKGKEREGEGERGHEQWTYLVVPN